MVLDIVEGQRRVEEAQVGQKSTWEMVVWRESRCDFGPPAVAHQCGVGEKRVFVGNTLHRQQVRRWFLRC